MNDFERQKTTHLMLYGFVLIFECSKGHKHIVDPNDYHFEYKDKNQKLVVDKIILCKECQNG